MHNDLTSRWIEEYCASKERTLEMDICVEHCQIFRELFRSDYFYPEPFTYPKVNAKREKRNIAKVKSKLNEHSKSHRNKERVKEELTMRENILYDQT